MTAGNVLVCGATSFIAQALLRTGSHPVSVASKHDDLTRAAQGTRVIVNMLTDPRIKSQPYDPSIDRDLHAARAAYEAGAHFVMLSTRKVYGSRSGHLKITDDLAPNPNCYYGENKLTSEQAVVALLGDRVTILRVANVVGLEPGRPTFFGLALTKLLAESRIVLDVDPEVRRDFLPVDECARRLSHVLAETPPGIYPFAAGVSLPIGQVCKQLIDGFGTGHLDVTNRRMFDGFSVESDRHTALFGQFLNHDPLPEIRSIGRQLREQCA